MALCTQEMLVGDTTMNGYCSEITIRDFPEIKTSESQTKNNLLGRSALPTYTEVKLQRGKQMSVLRPTAV